MDKQDFLSRLRAALNGRIPVPQVEETINYYRDYINVEMRKGRSEEEVLSSLGDPRLIARTIIQTNGMEDDKHVSSGGDYRESDYHGEPYQDGYGGYHGTRRSFRIPIWLLTFFVIFLVIFIIGIVFSILTFLAPLIIVMGAVIFMVKLFRDWLN